MNNHLDPVFLARRYHPAALRNEHDNATVFGDHAYTDALSTAILMQEQGETGWWLSWPLPTLPDSTVERVTDGLTCQELETNIGAAVRALDRTGLYLAGRALKLRKEER